MHRNPNSDDLTLAKSFEKRQGRQGKEDKGDRTETEKDICKNGMLPIGNALMAKTRKARSHLIILWEAVKRAIAFPLPHYSLPSRKSPSRYMPLPKETLDLRPNSENMD